MTGVERLGWGQMAADSDELSTFHYAVYLDGARAELTGASCQPPASPASAIFDCSAPIPAMSAGAHTLELAAFIVVDGAPLESARSAPLRREQDGRCRAGGAPGPPRRRGRPA